MAKSQTYYYCSILPKGLGSTYYYISPMGALQVGTRVEVPFGYENDLKKGTVLSCGEFTEEDAPYPVSKTKSITRVLTEEEFAQGGSQRKQSHWMAGSTNDLKEVTYYMEYHDYDAMYHWASEHHDCIDDPEVMKRVIECYQQCIEQNMPAAALNLGTLYYKGQVVPQDFAEAARLYKIAADAGILRAICNLGYCFYYGRHQEVDYAKAFEYFLKGALLFDDVNCLYKLGDMYLHGYGTEKNELYARILYQRALKLSENEDDPENAYCLPDVQFRVGKCLLRGIGIAPNAEQALPLLMAALCGFYRRQKTDPFAQGLIDGSKELIAEAQSVLDGDE